MRKRYYAAIVVAVAAAIPLAAQQPLLQNMAPKQTIDFPAPPPAVIVEGAYARLPVPPPRGGNPPYHFQKDTMGKFPPMGMTINPVTGAIEGVPSHASPFPVVFDNCAVDLSQNWRCVPVTITVRQATADEQRQQARLAQERACPATFAQLGQTTAAFENDALRNNAAFLATNRIDAAIRGGQGVFQSQVRTAATGYSARDIVEFRSAFEAWQEASPAYRIGLSELEACLSPKAQCNLQDVVHRQTPELRSWTETLLSGGTDSATNRVRQTRSVLENYVSRVAGAGDGSLYAAIGCLNDAQQRAEAAENATGETHARVAPATNGNTSKPKEGMSGSTKALIISGAALGGLAAAAPSIRDAMNAGAEGDCYMEIQNAKSCGPFGESGCANLIADADACCESIGKSYTRGASQCK